MTTTGYLARNAVHVGDVRELAGRLEPASVQTIVTSPPYFGLRDYGTGTWEGGAEGCDHARFLGGNGAASAKQVTSGGTQKYQYTGTCAKCGAARVDRQLGMEATPEEYVANLVAVFAALRPALKDDGTVWLNLGDAYANDTKWGGATGGKHAAGIHGATGIGRQKVSTGVPPKSLLMIPHRVALALQADGWVIRMDCVWSKPNPMPESVTDRPTRSHEYLFLIAKSPRYYYDATAIAEAISDVSMARISQPNFANQTGGPKDYGVTGINASRSMRKALENFAENGQGKRNRRSVWTVPPAQFADAHYATFSPDLIRPCVLAGTSERGECAACGKAWVRVVESSNPSKCANVGVDMSGGAARTGNPQTSKGLHRNGGGVYSTRQTTGWRPQCRCDAPTRPQLVLDPFSGSGTTGEVAHEEGRDYIGIDLDGRAVRWYQERRARLPVGRLAGV